MTLPGGWILGDGGLRREAVWPKSQSWRLASLRIEHRTEILINKSTKKKERWFAADDCKITAYALRVVASPLQLVISATEATMVAEVRRWMLK